MGSALVRSGRAAAGWFVRRFPKTAALLGLGGAAYVLTDIQALLIAAAAIVGGAVLLSHVWKAIG